MHLVIHAPFGSRLNRAWGLALRKRFCRTFNFELQAAATEDAIVLSLGAHAQLPAGGRLPLPALEHGAGRADPGGARLAALRRALALERGPGAGHPPPAGRPEGAGAAAAPAGGGPDRRGLPRPARLPGEHRGRARGPGASPGRADPPGLPGRGHGHRGRWRAPARRIEAGEVELVARDVVEPSPLAHEILKAQPYAFLDDAPLEERRTQAVSLRRWLDPETASDLGRAGRGRHRPGARGGLAGGRDAGRAARRPDDPRLRDGGGGGRSGWEPLFDALSPPRAAGYGPGDGRSSSLGGGGAAAADPGDPS